MPKLLQINPVLRMNTSTGRIMQEIGDVAMSAGWESFVAYSKGRDGMRESTSKTVPVGNRFSVAVHGLGTRLFDRHGLASNGATKAFIKKIEEIDPDIIHIHNIHGYFLNYQILFDYLSRAGKPVIWTIHDCWLYTGHCYYYTSAGCDRWKTGCGHCPQKRQFPASLVFDRSAQNFKDKAKAFCSMPKDLMTIVPVSEWMRDETENGKLYINYPMIESIRYTKELPDNDYANYVVSREECKDFKRLARNFSAYDSLDHILLKDGETPTKEKYMKVKDNWQFLKQMNVSKANLLIAGVNAMPKEKSVVNQLSIFERQLLLHVKPNRSVAVLNSFPIFIYEYMK